VDPHPRLDRPTEPKETKQEKESPEYTLPSLFPTLGWWSDIIIIHTHLPSYVRIGRQTTF
jgi:hypothetical protein